MTLPLAARFASLVLLGTLGAPATLFGQGGPPFPPPLPPVVSPPGNPSNPDKVQLGKALFFEEQISSSGTVACATCHVPEAGGSDIRSRLNPADSTHPGLDSLFGTPDDIRGSMGRILTRPDGRYASSTEFGLEPQVTGRKSPSAINAVFFPALFWDGRATEVFTDPVTGAVVLPARAALESQAAGPPTSEVEMAHQGESWPAIAARVAVVQPLALASDLPPALAAFLDARSYPELFQIAFGSPGVTPARIAMAIAAYERTLVSDQSPFDRAIAGVPGALNQQQQRGWGVFNSPQTNCVVCHAGALTSNSSFRNIGVRPIPEDQGRGGITGNPADNGRFKVPSLRNVALRAPYFHNGTAPSLQAVVAFYNRGGDFGANQDPLIRPLGLEANQRADLVAFLGALTDPRVAPGLPPFDRPTLYTESNRIPVLYGAGSTRDGVPAPRAIAVEPPHLGNPSLTLGVKNGATNAPSLLLLDLVPSIGGIPVRGIILHLAASPSFFVLPTGPTQGALPGQGFTSVSIPLPPVNPLAPGQSLFLQWVLMDPFALVPLMASEGIELRLF